MEADMTLERILQAAVNSLGQGKRKAHCSDGGMRSVQSEVDNLQYCAEYGEPGYDNPRKGIVFANWNHFPRGMDDILERAGYAIEWSDEWVISYETSKAYRSSPDSYSWLPYYIMTDDGEIIGGDEIESGDQAETYIEMLLNNPRQANVFHGLDLSKYGFKLAFPGDDDCETGFHPGQNGDPKEQMKRAQSKWPDHDVVFEITGQGQFDTSWRAWVRPQEG
jgi:hypothetical protein